MKLSKAKIGESKVIVKVLEGGKLSYRLFEMGIIVGTKVKIVRIAPLKDPYLLSIRGYYLALRKEIVDLIIVED